MMTAMYLVGLLDCNNFFVSCERLFRPDLRQIPTVVLSSNDGCVVARSQEVKAMGIPMGVPYFKVKKELDQAEAAVFSANFKLYRDISHRVMATLRELVGEVEQYSVDEAFFILKQPAPEVADELREIKQAIERHIGVPVSVGAAKTKTIAKYASQKGKTNNGICFLTGQDWRTETISIPVSAIWSIGRKTEQQLRQLGVNTAADYVALDPARVDRLFGVHGIRLQAELSEQPAYTLASDQALQQSIMSTRSLASATNDQRTLEDAVIYHITQATESLRQQGAVAQSLWVMLRPGYHGDWSLRGGVKEVILPQPTNDTRVLITAARQLVQSLYEPAVPYKKVGAILGLLSYEAACPEPLFANQAETVKKRQLLETIDTLNQTFGRHTVTIGRLPGRRQWTTNSAYLSPQYTTKWTDIMTVRC